MDPQIKARGPLTFVGPASQVRANREGIPAFSPSRVVSVFQLTREPPIQLIILLALAAIIYHSWLTIRPLSAGDWGWFSSSEVRRWFPWPTVWEPQAGLGIKYFQGSYEFPIQAIAGLLAEIGVGWGLIEKLLYFWPFAILSFLSPWAFFRNFFGKSRWALVSGILFACSTYFFIFVVVNGQLFLAVADVLAPLVLITYARAVKPTNWRWALVCALLLGLQAAYEIRVTYLTALLMGIYLLVLLAADVGWRSRLKRVSVTLAVFVCFAGLETYWILPLITYTGDRGLPFAAAPWLAFMRLSNGITGLAPYWTGGAPALFRLLPVPPTFFVLPLIALAALLGRRIAPEALWLCVLALAAAFLIKQDNPPGGQVYDWMFSHVPGWNLFREASKLYFIVALAFSALIPLVLSQLLRRWPREVRSWRVRQALGVILLAVVGVLTVSVTFPVVRGDLGYTSRPISEPSTVVALDRRFNEDLNFGRVMWFGGAWLNVPSDGDRRSPFAPRSRTHPFVELTGALDPTGDPLAFRSDPLQSFCRIPSEPFCYLENGLFQYLLARTGAEYVVLPLTDRMGVFPEGVTRSSLFSKLDGMLGTALLFGSQEDRVALWKINTGSTEVNASNSVALVEGTPGVTSEVLPALTTLGLPVVYSNGPAGVQVPTRLESVVSVLPRIGDSCSAPLAGSYVVFARGGAPTVAITIGSTKQVLVRAIGGAISDWSAYGPVHLASGPTPIGASGAAELGPCMGWPDLAGLNSGPDSREVVLANKSTNDRVAAIPNGAKNYRWYELRRAYDAGWTVPATNHYLGDGLFNLYYTARAQETMTFVFSTTPWESRGLFISICWLALILGLLGFATLAASKDRTNLTAYPATQLAPRSVINDLGRYSAIAGLILLSIATAFDMWAWLGLPSATPNALGIIGPLAGPDPYGAVELYAAGALVACTISVLFHMASLVKRS